MNTQKRMKKIAKELGMTVEQVTEAFHSLESGESIEIGEKTMKRIDEKNKRILRVTKDQKVISNLVIR